MALSSCLELEVNRQHKGSNTYPSSVGVCYGGNGGADSVNGGRNQQQEVTGGEEAIRRHEEAEQDTRGLRGFEEISKISPVGIYIPNPIDVTEWNNSVAPRFRITRGYCNSVRSKCSYRLHRDSNLDQLNELGMTERNESVRLKCIERFWKFKSMTNRWLRVLLTQRVRI